MNDEDIFQEAVNQWGVEAQFDQVIEECAELIQAIEHVRRGRVDPDKLVEEAVDVELCLFELKYILSEYTENYKKWWRFKIDRLKERLEKGENL